MTTFATPALYFMYSPILCAASLHLIRTLGQAALLNADELCSAVGRTRIAAAPWLLDRRLCAVQLFSLLLLLQIDLSPCGSLCHHSWREVLHYTSRVRVRFLNLASLTKSASLSPSVHCLSHDHFQRREPCHLGLPLLPVVLLPIRIFELAATYSQFRILDACALHFHRLS